MSLALAQAAPMVDVHARLIHNLEQVAGLAREIEFLPTDEEISDRKAAHQGLVSPEMAVVMAYCKIHLYAQLLDSDEKRLRVFHVLFRDDEIDPLATAEQMLLHVDTESGRAAAQQSQPAAPRCRAVSLPARAGKTAC